MVVIRRRLIFWIIKEYFKKSGKTLIFFFFLGLIIFASLIFGSRYVSKIIPIQRKAVIGVVGSYHEQNLPPVVIDKLSRGLTKVNSDGSVKGDLASDWQITDNGKTYTFNLRPDVSFNDKNKLTSDALIYNFSDVAIERPDKSKVVFKLKNAYSPFLATVSRPVFKKGYIGVGEYNLRDVELNGNFVQSLTLAQTKNRFDTVRFQFYPSEDALKTAYLLGEITQAEGLSSINVEDTSFEKFPDTKVTKTANYESLVGLFYNTSDGVLSDKKLRLGLDYALPDTYPSGEKAYLPYPSSSVYYNSGIMDRKQDLERAKILLPESEVNLTIKTLKKYKKTADAIAGAWNKIGVKTTVEEVDLVPDRFQIFLGDFNVPKDPDQYVLWRSGQLNNITKYRNVRVDKLLEDGRKTVDTQERKNIYADFQKVLFDDVPASFLYFPYEYDVSRN